MAWINKVRLWMGHVINTNSPTCMISIRSNRPKRYFGLAMHDKTSGYWAEGGLGLGMLRSSSISV